MDRKTTEFVIYIINEISNRLNLYPSHIYRVLKETGCISQYLVSYYDVLHTMSSDSIVDDVLEYIEVRGVAL